MRLNPYHPLRYWTHLARAQYHLGDHGNALSSLANITKPRVDDFVYEIVALRMLGDADASSERVNELGRRFPEFEVDQFIGALPYTAPPYSEAIAIPLKEAFREA
jgi:adenylate cyclase